MSARNILHAGPLEGCFEHLEVAPAGRRGASPLLVPVGGPLFGDAVEFALDMQFDAIPDISPGFLIWVPGERGLPDPVGQLRRSSIPPSLLVCQQ